MSLLYLVVFLLILGAGAVWAFIWVLQNGKLAKAPPHANHHPTSHREVSHGPAAKPGLDVKHGEAPARPAVKPKEAAKRRAS